MKGTISNYENNTGTISGYDGNQYRFVRFDWGLDHIKPKVGMEVDFEIDGERARKIVLLKMPNAPSKTKLAALCFFLGMTGVHRFMVGKSGTGLLILLMPIIIPVAILLLFMITGGRGGGMHVPSLGPLIVLSGSVSFLWAMLDFFMILTDNFTDKQGNKIE